MSKRVLCFLLALTAAAVLSGCATGYKSAVTLWAEAQLPLYLESIEKEFAGDRQGLVRRLMQIADLQCLIDEDTKLSTTDEPTLACRCANPPNEEAREEACMKWLEVMKE